MGSSWKIVCGSQLGPTCITHGQLTWAPCRPTGQNVVGPTWAAQVGPTSQPTLAPSGSNVAFLLGVCHSNLVTKGLMHENLASRKYLRSVLMMDKI